MHMAYRKHAGVAALSAQCLSLLIRRSVGENNPPPSLFSRFDLIRCSWTSCLIAHVMEINTPFHSQYIISLIVVSSFLFVELAIGLVTRILNLPHAS